MISIKNINDNEFREVYKLVGNINGLIQHQEHVYKIMSDHFNRTFLVAKDRSKNSNAEILGFILGILSQTHKGQLFIWQVGVSEKARGMHIGSRLLEYMIEITAVEEKYESIMATVETDNIASQKLFERQGFTISSSFYREKGQELIIADGKEAIKNYYGSGTDQIFYVKYL